jgi:hypothetical protein
MRDVASRTGMQELTVRALLHSASLGDDADAAAAALLATGIDNPRLGALVSAVRGVSRCTAQVAGGVEPPATS